MKKIVFAAILLAVAMPSLAIAKGNDKWGDGGPQDMHCPKPWTEKYEVHGEKATKAANNLVLPFGTIVCVKASTFNTGIQVTDGYETLLDLVSNAGSKAYDVSYYVIYGRLGGGPTSSPTPATPTPTQTVQPTILPTESATPSGNLPSATPLVSPSETPTSEPTTPGTPEGNPTLPDTATAKSR